MNHTPGPYTVEAPGQTVSAKHNGKSYDIATFHSAFAPGQNKANAYLFATSLEMLEALKECVAEIDKRNHSITESPAASKALAIIAKLTSTELRQPSDV